MQKQAPSTAGFLFIPHSLQGPSDDEEIRTDGKHGRVLHGGWDTAVVEWAASAHGPDVSITPKCA